MGLREDQALFDAVATQQSDEDICAQYMAARCDPTELKGYVAEYRWKKTPEFLKGFATAIRNLDWMA